MENIYLPLMKDLENVYGKENNDAFGSAVFHGTINKAESIENISKIHYKSFIGSKWTPATEATWMKVWKNVYARKTSITPGIISELNGITDANAKISVPLLTDLIENAELGKQALSAAFNHADVTDLSVYLIGDGEALSGILLSAKYSDNYNCTVISLMD